MGRKKKMADESSNQEHSGDDGEQDNVIGVDHQSESVEELISNYKLVDLKNICRSLNLKVTGNKRPVAERIWNYYHNPQLNEEDQASSPASNSQDSYYQQQQQHVAAQQLQYQQQQQYLQSLPLQQQQAFIAFNQNLAYIQQQIMILQSQGQPIPTPLQASYMNMAHIHQQPIPNQIQLIMQLMQHQMQVQMQMQQAGVQQQQQQNGESLKRPRENELPHGNAKRLKTSNADDSQVMGIVKALMSERADITDRSKMIISLQSVEGTKEHLSQILNALLLATMDSVHVVDCIAYVLYEVLDKKVLDNYFHKQKPEEIVELRNLVTEYASRFILRCGEDQGDEDLAKSESLAKLIDLISWFSVLDFVSGGGEEEQETLTILQNLQQMVIDASKKIFHLYPEAYAYIQSRFETLKKVINVNELATEAGIQALRESKPYFDASALEVNSKSATLACTTDNQVNSLWNTLVETLKSKNVALPADLPLDEVSADQYNFDKRCNDRADHWWLHKFVQRIIPITGLTEDSAETTLVPKEEEDSKPDNNTGDHEGADNHPEDEDDEEDDDEE